MAEEAVVNSEGKVTLEGNGARIFGFISLAVFFIWGQGTTCLG